MFRNSLRNSPQRDVCPEHNPEMHSEDLNTCPHTTPAPGCAPVAAAQEDPAQPAYGAAAITELLSRAGGGDREAFDRLIPIVYQELHRLAEGHLRREWKNQTLQPTALIHEAYARMVVQGGQPQDRAQFFGIASRVMRQILVDYARSRNAAKRGADAKVTLQPGLDFAPDRDRVVIALDDALQSLARSDAHKAELVEMRFFAGMTAVEIAECLALPVHTVRRELRTAQAWLRREIEA
jgi:RNA polymerase sigma factor (TIGR02999 family)